MGLLVLWHRDSKGKPKTFGSSVSAALGLLLSPVLIKVRVGANGWGKLAEECMPVLIHVLIKVKIGASV